MVRRWTRFRGKREGEREKERDIERPGPRVNNKGTSVPAPGPAQLGGGRRAEEANEDKEELGVGWRAHGKEPWRKNHGPLLYSKKTGSTLTWALADIRGGSGSTRAPPPPPSSPNWAGVSVE